jgi:hypothetical protein
VLATRVDEVSSSILSQSTRGFQNLRFRSSIEEWMRNEMELSAVIANSQPQPTETEHEGKRLSVRLGNTLQLILLLDGVGVR